MNIDKAKKEIQEFEDILKETKAKKNETVIRFKNVARLILAIEVVLSELDKRVKQMKEKIVLYIIFILTIIFLLMNIKIRNDLIWELRIKNADLKEQIHILSMSKESED